MLPQLLTRKVDGQGTNMALSIRKWKIELEIMHPGWTDVSVSLCVPVKTHWCV